MGRVAHNALPFEEYVREAPNGCREWTASRYADGYGACRRQRAHRFFYERVHGPIPAGMLVLHRCDNPICVNPEHLFLGTHADNMRDMAAKGRNWNQKKTHCSKGHPFDEKNTHIYNGHRQCRACNRIASAELRARKARGESPHNQSNPKVGA